MTAHTPFTRGFQLGSSIAGFLLGLGAVPIEVARRRRDIRAQARAEAARIDFAWRNFYSVTPGKDWDQ